LGFPGAWIGTLTALEPYRTIFIGLAVVALLIAVRRIRRPAVACARGHVCAMSRTKLTYKALFGTVAVLVFVAVTFPFLAPLFY
jgi:mercuric ion transport protein